jgi:hypothetical protein
LNACAVAHLAGPLDDHVLRIALNWMQKRHPLLKTRLDIMGGSTRRLPDEEALLPIPLRLVPRQTDDDWLPETMRELESPLPWARGSLISVALLHADDCSDIILTLHHVLNDSATVLYLLRDLLGLLVQLMKGSHTPGLYVFPERRALDRLPIGTSRLMDSLFQTTALMVTHVTNLTRPTPGARKPRHVLRRRSQPKPNPLEHGVVLRDDAAGRLMHYRMSGDEVKALEWQCRQQNTTPHAAIAAAALQAVSRLVSAFAPVMGVGRIVQCLSASGVRNLMTNCAAVELARFEHIVTSIGYSAARAHFWDTARHIRMVELPMNYAGHAFVTAPLPALLARYLLGEQSNIIIVTNVGRALTAPTASTPYDTLAAAHSSREGIADALCIVHNRVRRGHVLSFFYPERVLSDERVNPLGADIVANLRSAIGAD